MDNRFRWVLLAALLTLLVAMLASCGRKTELLTPDSPRPEGVKDLSATVRDAVAFLSWSVPTKNVEGKDLPPGGIVEFGVYRAEIDRERKRPYYKQVAVINLANPAPARVRDGTVFWSDSGLKYGKTFAYRVRAYGTRGSVSTYSTEVRVVPLLSLVPPKRVTAKAGDRVVELSWETVTTLADGSAHQGFVGYNVYRGTEPGRQEKVQLNREPVQTNVYRDAVVNDRTYYYLIRAVDGPAPSGKESLDSEEVSATAKDMTPPDKPTGLTVVPGIGRVFLTWNENREGDLAGYQVYRATKSGGAYEQLTEKPINRTTYSDTSVKQGMTYYYTVTAVDKAGNESLRSRERKTYTEKIR
jgi:predicted small lipoprotein YifL